MKKYSSLLFLITLIVSCNTKQSEKVVPGTDTTEFVNKTDSISIKTDSHYYWISEEDPKKGLVMKRAFPLSPDSLTSTILIQMLNKGFPEIQIQFSRVSNDSIFVKIRKSAYLTQQMGSSGAEAYLAEVIYNLTELKGINYVDIRFKEGDHASPGTYSRTDFYR
ncbi:MAG: hypothetical protein ABI760_00315 [Ferruginibacter sp.]